MGRKSRLFAHSVSSPDCRFGELEVEIAESLRPCSRIFPFCGDYRVETGLITTAARPRQCMLFA
jgi:hypothetical protein